MKLTWSSVLLIVCFPLLSIAQGSTVQDDWLAPTLPDQSATLTIGNLYTFKWTANLRTWFAYYAAQADPTNCDIWLVRGTFGSKIVSNIDMTTTLNYTWAVTVPDTQLSQGVNYAVQFRQAGTTYNPSGSRDSISSPVFNIRAAQASGTPITSSTSSSPVSASTQSSVSSTGSTASSQTSSASAKSSSSSGISAGAIAGVVIGTVAVIALIVFGAWFIVRKKKKDRLAGVGLAPDSMKKHTPYHGVPVYSQATNYAHQPRQYERYEMPDDRPKHLRAHEMGTYR